jgi:hypothetical protein
MALKRELRKLLTDEHTVGQSDNYSDVSHFISSASSCHTGLRYGPLMGAEDGELRRAEDV